MNRKKIMLYILAFIAVMTASMLFSMSVGKIFGMLPRYEDLQDSDGSEPDSLSLSGIDEQDDISLTEISQSAAGKIPKQEGNVTVEGGDAADDIRFSDESIQAYYTDRDRGNDLDDRYDQLALEAEFDRECGDLEKDRIALVRQLRGYLENTIPEGRDVQNLSFYGFDGEYFVRVSVDGVCYDFHIIQYDGVYDFETAYLANPV